MDAASMKSATNECTLEREIELEERIEGIIRQKRETASD
jgi:hypothetical protein